MTEIRTMVLQFLTVNCSLYDYNVLNLALLNPLTIESND